MKEDRDYLLEVRNLNTFYIEEESIFTSKKRKKQVKNQREQDKIQTITFRRIRTWKLK